MEEPERCPPQSTAHFTCQEPWFSDFALLAIWFLFAQLPCFARHALAQPQPNTSNTQTILVEDGRSSQQPLAEVGFKSWLFRWEFDEVSRSWHKFFICFFHHAFPHICPYVFSGILPWLYACFLFRPFFI